MNRIPDGTFWTPLSKVACGLTKETTFCGIPGCGRAWRSRGRRRRRRPRGTPGLAAAAPPATLCRRLRRRREVGAAAGSGGGGGPGGDPGRRCGPMRSRSRRWKSVESHTYRVTHQNREKLPFDLVLTVPAAGGLLLWFPTAHAV